MSEWIYCDEDLPKKCGRYLCLQNLGRQCIANYTGEGEWTVEGSYPNNKPYAWMPFPKAVLPKEITQDKINEATAKAKANEKQRVQKRIEKAQADASEPYDAVVVTE